MSNPDLRLAMAKKLHFHSSYGVSFLTAERLSELLGVSRSHAYRIIKSKHLTDQQSKLLETSLFGAIHDWPGWSFHDGSLVDPDGYKFSPSDVLRLKQMSHLIKLQQREIEHLRDDLRRLRSLEVNPDILISHHPN